MTDYQKGYAAGRRARDHEARMARYALAAAIVPEVLRSPWVDGNGNKLNTAKGTAGVVADLVKEIAKRIV